MMMMMMMISRTLGRFTSWERDNAVGVPPCERPCRAWFHGTATAAVVASTNSRNWVVGNGQPIIDVSMVWCFQLSIEFWKSQFESIWYHYLSMKLVIIILIDYQVIVGKLGNGDHRLIRHYDENSWEMRLLDAVGDYLIVLSMGSLQSWPVLNQKKNYWMHLPGHQLKFNSFHCHPDASLRW